MKHHQYTGNLAVSTILAFMLIPLGGLSTDIYIPSLPSMAYDLGVSEHAVQVSLLLFMISAGVSQLFIGSILDSYGRYRISIYSLGVFVVASVLIAVIPNLNLIYAMRVLQGISVALIIVGKRAYFADVYEEKDLVRYTSWFSIVWAIAPIIAPFIGGYLQKIFGWQSSFVLLAGLAFLLLLLELRFSRESLQQLTPFNRSRIIATYKGMLETADFTLGLLIVGLSYALLVVYSMASPFIIEQQFSYSPVITGYSSLLSGASLMTGGLLSRVLLNKSLFAKLHWGIGVQAFFSVAMMITGCYFESFPVLLFFTIPLHIMSGFIFNNVYAYCLRRFTDNAGTASGLTGGGIYVVSSLVGYGLINLFNIRTMLELALVNFSIIFLLLLVVFLFISKARSGRRLTGSSLDPAS